MERFLSSLLDLSRIKARTRFETKSISVSAGSVGSSAVIAPVQKLQYGALSAGTTLLLRLLERAASSVALSSAARAAGAAVVVEEEEEEEMVVVEVEVEDVEEDAEEDEGADVGGEEGGGSGNAGVTRIHPAGSPVSSRWPLMSGSERATDSTSRRNATSTLVHVSADVSTKSMPSCSANSRASSMETARCTLNSDSSMSTLFPTAFRYR